MHLRRLCLAAPSMSGTWQGGGGGRDARAAGEPARERDRRKAGEEAAEEGEEGAGRTAHADEGR